MGTNTSLAPLYAWSRWGERALANVPRNWGGERHPAGQHNERRDGAVFGGRRPDYEGGLRSLPGAGAGAVAWPAAGSSDGQPLFTQSRSGARAHRGEGLRAHVPASLLPRSQSHRRSVREAQVAVAQGWGTYPRGAHRGDGPSPRRGDSERCSRLLRAPRLPREGLSAMTDALVLRHRGFAR